MVKPHFGGLHAREALGAQVDLLLGGRDRIPSRGGRGCGRLRRRPRRDGDELVRLGGGGLGFTFGKSSPHRGGCLSEKFDRGDLDFAPTIDDGLHRVADFYGEDRHPGVGRVGEEGDQGGRDFAGGGGGHQRVARFDGGGEGRG